MEPDVCDGTADVEPAFFKTGDQFSLDPQVVDFHVGDRVARRNAAQYAAPGEVARHIANLDVGDAAAPHGGAIEVESELGQGTTFIIKLPAATHQENLYVD